MKSRIAYWGLITLIVAGGIAISFAGTELSPRVRVWIGHKTVSPYDTLIKLPVFVSNPIDTIAGIELNMSVDENPYLYFALDDIKEDGMETAVDTAGSLISGWEWVGINSSETDLYKMKVAAMADWPDNTVTPPLAPQDSGLLMTLVFRMDELFPFRDSVTVSVNINPEHTGLSDAFGNTIGIIVSYEKKCVRYVGDSCISWKNKRVGRFDSTIVRFESGSISIRDTIEAVEKQ